ncbi:acyltransferase [Arthrobacter wenxiniae]|uniref:Acyltransferase n=1 Tax=Arthrobacter wenxiniae TaxID=2713570 RepID=A0A7Y7LX37_9MICC|nr:DapH/DapD/GlmU-related protein [Arthrobacter wenxiniae]NVM93925.1 acyltransferase [Arthrobacter wenxiniae]
MQAKIDSSVVIMTDGGRDVTVGDHTQILRGTEILGPVVIGSNTYINRDNYIRAETTIGNHVAVGPFCRFVTDSHEIGSTNRRAGKNTVNPIFVGDGTWIGASVTILGGVKIGRGCVIAAGSVVIKDIPDNCLAAGVPAKIVRRLEAPTAKNPVLRHAYKVLQGLRKIQDN